MAWTAIVTLDADKVDVGTVEAIWNVTKEDELRYSRRAQVSGADLAAFVAEAKALLAAQPGKDALKSAAAIVVTNALNK